MLSKGRLRLTAALLLTALLAGCSSEPIGEFNDVTVVEKRVEERTVSERWTEYYVTFDNGATRVELEVENESAYNALIEGAVVDVKYDDHYVVVQIKWNELNEGGDDSDL